MARSRALQRVWAFAALGGLAQSLSGAAGALLVREVGGSDVMAGLPQAALVLGAGFAAVVLSAVATRRGRGRSLSYGGAVAVLGCLTVVGGAVSAALPVILIGTCVLGAGNAAVMLSRYAAPELSPTSSRPRAMASVLAATTIGAIVGPNLLGPSTAVGRLIRGPDLLGAYVVAGAVFLVAAVVVAGARTSPTSATDAPARSTSHNTASSPTIAKALTTATWDLHAVIGLIVLAVANLVMVAVMTMAPLQMSRHGGGLGLIGLVVSAHIAAMFAPSAASGRLAERIGSERTAIIALTTLAIACGYAALAEDPLPLGGAMVLLGVGWNLALVSGSDLLTRSVAPVDRPRRESLGEFGMATAATTGGAGSGAVMGAGGYSSLAIVSGVIAALALAGLLTWLRANAGAFAIARTPGESGAVVATAPRPREAAADGDYKSPDECEESAPRSMR